MKRKKIALLFVRSLFLVLEYVCLFLFFIFTSFGFFFVMLTVCAHLFIVNARLTSRSACESKIICSLHFFFSLHMYVFGCFSEKLYYCRLMHRTRDLCSCLKTCSPLFSISTILKLRKNEGTMSGKKYITRMKTLYYVFFSAMSMIAKETFQIQHYCMSPWTFSYINICWLSPIGSHTHFIVVNQSFKVKCSIISIHVIKRMGRTEGGRMNNWQRHSVTQTNKNMNGKFSLEESRHSKRTHCEYIEYVYCVMVYLVEALCLCNFHESLSTVFPIAKYAFTSIIKQMFHVMHNLNTLILNLTSDTSLPIAHSHIHTFVIIGFTISRY